MEDVGYYLRNTKIPIKMGKLKSAAIIGLGISGTYAFGRVLKAILNDKAKPTLYIDFDGTICKDEFPNAGPPQPYIKESLKRLSKACLGD